MIPNDAEINSAAFSVPFSAWYFWAKKDAFSAIAAEVIMRLSILDAADELVSEGTNLRARIYRASVRRILC